MRYLLLNSLFIISVFVFIFITKKYPNKIALYTLITVLLFTVLFDSLIILAGVVGYNTEHLLGLYIWRAPIEDFSYAVVSVILMYVLWEYNGKNK